MCFPLCKVESASSLIFRNPPMKDSVAVNNILTVKTNQEPSPPVTISARTFPPQLPPSPSPRYSRDPVLSISIHFSTDSNQLLLSPCTIWVQERIPLKTKIKSSLFPRLCVGRKEILSTEPINVIHSQIHTYKCKRTEIVYSLSLIWQGNIYWLWIWMWSGLRIHW